jgi:hypothetical protein
MERGAELVCFSVEQLKALATVVKEEAQATS